jgi:hypothetical protein
MSFVLPLVRRTAKVLTAAALLTACMMALVAGTANAATGVVGYHSAKTNYCSGREITIPAPRMYAVNSTTSVDRQTVAYEPVLFKWNSSTQTWGQYSTGMPLWGVATDSSSPGTWYDFSTNANEGNGAQTLYMMSTGYYKVALHYWWYTNGSVTGSDYRWAPSYTSSTGVITSYCTVS